MRKEYPKFKIYVYGSQKDIEEAERNLDVLNLTGNEYQDRLTIQEAIDQHKIKADILYDGNTVYSFDKVIKHFKRALKSKPSPISEYGNGDYNLTDYLYDFLSLACGSIAHFNKYGWIGTYPRKQDLKNFCKRNEFGQDIVTYQPYWAGDRIKIAKELLAI